MVHPNEIAKIQRTHLERLAYVYIRQSSFYQVQFNTASTARQYNLADRAKELGWSEDRIIVVDQDQGQSGASLEGRDGFKAMLKEILLGRVGAVFSLEASRLARDSSDWHQLIKLCTTRNTLIIDELGIHNPQVFDDRLLLSIKGTLSDAELHLIASRLNGGRLQRAREGKFRFLLPVGYVYDATGAVIIDPSPEVQQTVRLFFDQFDRLGSAMAVVRYFRSNQLLLPSRFYEGSCHANRKMSPMNQSRARKMLHSPLYAGMYVYGQSRTDVRVLSTESLETVNRRVIVPKEEWAIVIRDAHEAYISEENYRRNLERLKDNLTRSPDGRGAPNRGLALLQGIVRCGVCGRGMSVKYPGKHRHPIYICSGERATTGSGGCQFIAATKVDAKVTELVLEAFQPAQLELSQSTFDRMEAQVNSIRDQWKRQLSEAEKEAQIAAQLFRQAALQNRHVSAQLQNDWEEALKHVEQIRQAEPDLPPLPSQLLSAAALEDILAITRDLREAWDAPTTEQKDRKELCRLLVKDVILIRKLNLIHMTVRWQGGGRLECEVPWLSFPDSQRGQPEVIEIIRKMAPVNTDHQIAETLNSLGYRSRWRNSFSQHSITDLRIYYQIPQGCPEKHTNGRNGPRGDGRYDSKDVAKMLKCSTGKVRVLCNTGKLDAIRSTPAGPLWIKIDPARISEITEQIHQRRKPERLHSEEVKNPSLAGSVDSLGKGA